MSSGASKLRLLLPKWLLLHVFTIAASVTMVFLGRWQWHVAHTHHGNIQYYAYAFQWWAFVGFALLMWYRIVLDYLRKASPDEGEATVVQPEPASRYLAYAPPTSRALDTDPERMRFNAYLADLNAADRNAADVEAEAGSHGTELKTADRKGSA